jgi:hypothetical protein
MFRQIAVIGTLVAASLWAETPVVLHDEEDMQQAGAVQFRGVTEADEVRVDGEVVNAKGLARSRYLLLLAPGDYEISVTVAETGKTCAARVTVLPAETVTPACERQPVRLARR